MNKKPSFRKMLKGESQDFPQNSAMVGARCIITVLDEEPELHIYLNNFRRATHLPYLLPGLMRLKLSVEVHSVGGRSVRSRALFNMACYGKLCFEILEALDRGQRTFAVVQHFGTTPRVMHRPDGTEYLNKDGSSFVVNVVTSVLEEIIK